MKKILIVFGTRPEAIKMAPIAKIFENSTQFETRLCVTGQHRHMLDQVLSFFELVPDYDLNLMKVGQNLYQLTSDVILGLKQILEAYNPDYVFVHGDTTTSTASALASFYFGARVFHVEAGLRTNDKQSPFPEEINRQLTGRIADVHFAPTDISKSNLLKENVPEKNIIITGNTVLDALKWATKKLEFYRDSEIDHLSSILNPNRKIILVTGHRRENFGQGFLNICKALKRLSQRKDIQIIYPVHLNPLVQQPVYDLLSNIENIKLLLPLSYPSFVWLMSKSYLILTDSGGVQEEAPGLGIPVLVMRNTTERPEAVLAGTVKLVGTDEDMIFDQTSLLLDDSTTYSTMALRHNPYGNGEAAIKILNFVLSYNL